MKAADFQRPVIYDYEGYASSEVHRHRCSAPDGVGCEATGAVAETVAAESVCRGRDRCDHHGRFCLD
jgi:hypothetical protein